MNVAIYCGSYFGNDKIYEESTKLLAQKLAQKDLNIVEQLKDGDLMDLTP